MIKQKKEAARNKKLTEIFLVRMRIQVMSFEGVVKLG